MTFRIRDEVDQVVLLSLRVDNGVHEHRSHVLCRVAEQRRGVDERLRLEVRDASRVSRACDAVGQVGLRAVSGGEAGASATTKGRVGQFVGGEHAVRNGDECAL